MTEENTAHALPLKDDIDEPTPELSEVFGGEEKAEEPAPVRKRRGRPKGSKNKPKGATKKTAGKKRDPKPGGVTAADRKNALALVKAAGKAGVSPDAYSAMVGAWVASYDKVMAED